MRIISGKYGGRKLAEFNKIGVRPTSDMLRESLFNILGDSVNGASFLDLFSGSGAIGIEALSRGAGRVVFNDNSHESLKLIEKNLQSLKCTDNYSINNSDYLGYIERQSEKFDYIYVDPPYGQGLGEKAVCSAEKILNDQGTIILEDEVDRNYTLSSLSLVDKRRYGRAFLYFFKKKKEACVFAGTFDPLTVGHVDIIEKCLNLYKKLIIVIGENQDKTPILSIEQRKELLKQEFSGNENIEIIVYQEVKDNFSDILKEKGVKYYIRGIRNEADKVYEEKYVEQNSKLYPFITTHFIKADKKFRKVSSSMIRQLISQGKDVSSFVPKHVGKALLKLEQKD